MSSWGREGAWGSLPLQGSGRAGRRLAVTEGEGRDLEIAATMGYNELRAGGGTAKAAPTRVGLRARGNYE